ncbi:MAG TPA: polysaccharide biosynthesis/export family protein [Candidatus Binatia bacterium]|nr:polysaccharide biosynthesis/export family protein [Candidatus Binatia bacterium]
MRSNRRIIRVVSAITASMMLGCGSVPQPKAPAQAPSAMAGDSTAAVNEINKALSLSSAQSSGSPLDYRIGPEDLLQVTIFNIPEQDARATPRMVMLRVSQQGVIVVPLAGEVNVKGKTVSDVQSELAKRYSKYIKNPQIGVMVTEYRQRVSVMGAVQKPGVFELTGPKTVMDMLALAGGVTEKAGNQVHVYRQDEKGNRQSMVIDLMVLANNTGAISDGPNTQAVNMAMQAGDVINVPQSGMFFVDGAVGKPGSYPLGRNYTLRQALATAGGVDVELADYSGVTINRRHAAEKMETIQVDLDAVVAGTAKDPLIQPDDVILVPTSGLKYFVKRFVGTIISGVSIGAIGGS